MQPVLIAAENPGPYTGEGNNTWFLDGEVPTLVDAGVGAAGHLRAIGEALGPRDLAQVLVTHGHTDHVSGVPALRAKWPGLVVLKFASGREAGIRALTDGEIVRAGSRDLVVLHTPGHAGDHVCFWDRDHAELYGGDMVLAGTSVLIPGGRGGNLRDYLASLERLAGLGLVRIYPGHGPVIDDPGRIIAIYIEHRLRREQEVVACLRDGIFTPAEIVRRIYPSIREDVRHAAELTVEAHLDKLRTEGRI